jgi:hydroxymethylbilane synthase
MNIHHPAMPESLTIATRESRLALWQAEHVQALLAARLPQGKVHLLGMTTRGDQILDRALHEVGGKGLFTKELEVALEEGRADLAVHSLKDVPMVLPDGFALAAILPREDPRDAFVSNRFASLESLPDGARIGTSSLRRAALLRARFPHCQVLPLRGNLDTRLAKLDRGEYDAIVLAAAGLKRLGLAERIRGVLPPSESLPAPGQGALGIEIRSDRTDVAAVLSALEDPSTRLAVTAERAVSRSLGGSCRVPLAAYATCEANGGIRLEALVAAVNGERIARVVLETPDSSLTAAEELGQQAAQALREQGAEDILAS